MKIVHVITRLILGGAREVVRDGENGFLLSPPPRRGMLKARAWQPLAEAMARLVSDPPAARRMGEQWPEDGLRRFDCREATCRVLKI